MKAPLFTDQITLYNHYKHEREDCWQRTVLRGVQARETAETRITDDGRLVAARTLHLTIPVDVDAGGRHYIAPELFASAQNKSAYWTLESTKNLDVAVLSADTPELSEAYTLRELAAVGYYTVKAVSDNTLRAALKHWKVVGV